MATLTTSVVVAGVTYRAGTTPPADVAAAITNPDCWDGERPTSTQGDAGPEGGEQTSGGPSEGEGGSEEPPEPEPAPEVDPAPAPAAAPATTSEPARNASAAAWREYATAMGQDVSATAKREDVIDALAAAGLIEP